VGNVEKLDREGEGFDKKRQGILKEIPCCLLKKKKEKDPKQKIGREKKKRRKTPGKSNAAGKELVWPICFGEKGKMKSKRCLLKEHVPLEALRREGRKVARSQNDTESKVGEG